MNKAEYTKRLIEVDLPIKRISEHARREKSIRQGHIATIHIWWARRPLAACRAVACAAMWPDPADDLCPDLFRKHAREEMLILSRENIKLLSRESYKRFIQISRNPDILNNNIELRNALLDFIADFSDWSNSANTVFLRICNNLTRISYESMGGIPGMKPMLVDSFAGGGAIPYEALRIGAMAFASDINPIPILLNKVVLNYFIKYKDYLSDAISEWGKWIHDEAEKELSAFYPTEEDGQKTIAYLWARTVKCEGPNCGAEIPLMRSLWLSKKDRKSTALKLVPDMQNKTISFEIIENAKPKDVRKGTIAKGTATCPVCGYTTPVTSIRKQLKEKAGGAKGAYLVAVRKDDINSGERTYRLPNKKDIAAANAAAQVLEKKIITHTGSLSLIPDEKLPPQGTLGFRVQLYGMETWGDVFSPRQLLCLSTFSNLIRKVGVMIESNDGEDDERIKALQTCLALALDRLADFNSSLCVLNSVGGRGVVHTFGRQALPMVWDFAETNPFNEVGANWLGAIEVLVDTLKSGMVIETMGQIEQASATLSPLPDSSAQCFFTDPPYYDAVPYADLSDFFYVWLKRTIGHLYPEYFGTSLTPKAQECIVDTVKGKDKNYFELNMKEAMAEGKRVLEPNGIGIVVFANKTTSGWEAQLQAMIDAGWVITGSWPIDTERPGRLRAQNSAALASSIHLVCRSRNDTMGNGIGDWRDVLQELPLKVREWMTRLTSEGVVGADAIFACIGPALEIYSRYKRVEKASGEQVRLREFLEYVWGAVSKEALNMIFEGANSLGFEEDARITAMWLWTLTTAKEKDDIDSRVIVALNEEYDEEDEIKGSKKQKTSGYYLEFDTARKIAQGIGAHLEKLDSIIKIEGETARLLPVVERVNKLFDKQDNENHNSKVINGYGQLSIFDLSDSNREDEQIEMNITLKPGITVLDKLHQSMILFSSSRNEALKRLLVEEGVGTDSRFWALAQALSALYPASSDEKRWVDGVLARKKSLGF